MKEKFVITKNVRRFQSAVQRVNHKLRGVERMALVEGKVGLGKTEAALQYGANNGAMMLTIWPRMSQHWLLSDLASELGLKPFWSTRKMVDQIVGELERPRTLIFDEIDHFLMSHDAKKIEALDTLRRIHDITHCPMIFIGEKGIGEKIKNLSRINDRIVERVNFEKLDQEDVKQFVNELSDFKFEPDALEKIAADSDGRIRPIISLIHAAENSAKVHGEKTIRAKDLK